MQSTPSRVAFFLYGILSHTSFLYFQERDWAFEKDVLTSLTEFSQSVEIASFVLLESELCGISLFLLLHLTLWTLSLSSDGHSMEILSSGFSCKAPPFPTLRSHKPMQTWKNSVYNSINFFLFQRSRETLINASGAISSVFLVSAWAKCLTVIIAAFGLTQDINLKFLKVWDFVHIIIAAIVHYEVQN